MQYDLRDVCIEILKFNLDSGNILKALDLADQLKLTRLKNSCIEFLKTKMEIDHLPRVIQSLEKQNILEVKAKAISFILENFEKISIENLGLYEDFLVKNFGIDTLPLFAKAAYSEKTYNGKWISELSKDGITDLKLILVNFGSKNLREIKNKEMFKDLPKKFLLDLVLLGLKNNERENSN